MTVKRCNHRWTYLAESETIVNQTLNVKKRWKYYWCEICGAIKQIAIGGPKRVVSHYHPSRSKK